MHLSLCATSSGNAPSTWMQLMGHSQTVRPHVGRTALALAEGPALSQAQRPASLCCIGPEPPPHLCGLVSLGMKNAGLFHMQAFIE